MNVSKISTDLIIGDINYANVAGQHLVYLNSFDVAVDLLEKRSSLYSDRAHSSMMKLFVYQPNTSNIIFITLSAVWDLELARPLR
jgi:hypothetical protein